jgi:hypothetical protein
MTVRRAVTLAACACAYVVTLAAITTPLGIAFGAVLQIVSLLPGVWIIRAIADQDGRRLASVTFGPLLGIALSSLALMVLWAAGARGAWTLLAAPAAVALLVVPARRLQRRLRFAVTLDDDWVWLLGLLLVVPFVVARPFALVGTDVAEGQVYRAYFTADHVWRRAVVSELAKGDFLPANPFYAGDVLHYYWLPHLRNAVEYRIAGATLGLDALLLMQSVFVDAFFVAFLYGLARLFVGRPWAAAGGVASALLFTSFEGAYALWDYWRTGEPLAAVRHLNIDAVSRWFFGGMPVDGLHRVLLYQPHHALGYAIGFLGLMVVARRSRMVDPIVFAIAGALLGLSVLISSFGGLMFTVAAAVCEGASVVRQRDWRRGVWHASAAALPLAAASTVVTLLHYVDHGGQVITVGLNPVATHNLWISSVLSFGGALLLSGLGVWALIRSRRRGLGAIAALAAVCPFFFFFVDIRDHQNVYVGWRVGHLLFMASVVPIALAFEYAADTSRWTRVMLVGALGAVILLAAPTVAIDLYNTQDIANRRMAAGFRWTLVLSHDELEAFRWIKAHTAPTAIFQVNPKARDTETWAYLPAFAERRMAVGLPISMVPMRKYEDGARLVHDMFELDDPASIHQLATRLKIAYILSGPPERALSPRFQRRLDARPDLYPLLFRNRSISIYGVGEALPFVLITNDRS